MADGGFGSRQNEPGPKPRETVAWCGDNTETTGKQSGQTRTDRARHFASWPVSPTISALDRSYRRSRCVVVAIIVV
jgi:hypothetical protein